MFKETTMHAIRVVLCLAMREDRVPISHRVLAEHLGASESYLSKVITHLTKQGILITQRGRDGGACLAREPQEITLLEVVRACEGPASVAFQPGPSDRGAVLCGFHLAMTELDRMLNETLAQWTLADMLVECDASPARCSGKTPCFLQHVWVAARACARGSRAP